MFCRNGRLSVRFCGGEIDVLGNRKQLHTGERVRIEGRLVSKIYKTGVYQKIQADEVMRIQEGAKESWERQTKKR